VRSTIANIASFTYKDAICRPRSIILCPPFRAGCSTSYHNYQIVPIFSSKHYLHCVRPFCAGGCSTSYHNYQILSISSKSNSTLPVPFVQTLFLVSWSLWSKQISNTCVCRPYSVPPIPSLTPPCLLNSHAGVQIVFYVLFGQVQMAFTFFLSALFTNPRTAVVAAYV